MSDRKRRAKEDQGMDSKTSELAPSPILQLRQAALAVETATTPTKQQKTMSRMNSNQKEAMIVFMEMNSELLAASVSKLFPKDTVDRLWSDLTDQLNALGHIAKPTSTWKKTWFDMKREVKAKLGLPPYPPHLLADPDDQSMAGQRGRIAALMTQATRMCQQHAVTSLHAALNGDAAEEHDNSVEDIQQSGNESPKVVEISVKCEPPDFMPFDYDELREMAKQNKQLLQQQQIEDIESRKDSQMETPEPQDAAAPPMQKASLQQQQDTPNINGKHFQDTSCSSPKQPRLHGRSSATAVNQQEQMFSAVLQMLAASNDRTAMALESVADAARGLGEAFRRHTAVEIEKVEALKQIASALRCRP